ncbi:MAG: response regulator [Actinobacteria bacterium]|nr:response regulator [Actinomycetota bacterium]
MSGEFPARIEGATYALVIDDSRAARMLIGRAVRSLGLETLDAEHGADALAVLEESGPVDVMLVDWNMPVMDGLEFLKRVRKIRAHAGTSILMISSESDPKMMARALIAGADDYLVKPVDAEVIGDRLSAMHLL